MKSKKIPQDVVGDIAILKFPKRSFWLKKKFLAKKFLKKHPSVKTVLEKKEKFSGRLRKLKTKHLAGIKTKEAIYSENGCVFRFNIDETYFSPRLSNERKEIAEEIAKAVKKGDRILVMFAGVAPYPITIAKILKSKKKKAEIISNEINKRANEFAERNIVENKLSDYITSVGGDANKLPQIVEGKFDFIVMPRPNLKETFLKTALQLSKKGTILFYYGFGTKESVEKEIERDTKNKIGKIQIRKAGDIGIGKWRWLARFEVK